MNNFVIDKIDFVNLEAMKYWSHPRTYDINKKKEESKYMCLSGDYYGSRKYDGTWNMIIKGLDGNFYVRSRSESVNGDFPNKAEWIPQITKDLSKLPNGTVLLGEIYFPNNEGSRKVTSVFNCLREKCLERQEKGEKLHFYIFDVLAYDGKNIMDLGIKERITKYLNEFIYPITKKAEYLELAEYKAGRELWDLYGSIIAAGGEGIVISRKDCAYMPGKRTARMTLKLKKEINETIDAFVTGKYKLATREYKGKESLEKWNFWENRRTGEKFNTCKIDEYSMGEPLDPISKAYYYNWATSIELGVYKDGAIVPIGWVSGISDEIKAEIVKENNSLINQVVEVTCMEIEHIDNSYSLRHGAILNFRKDKKAEDCLFSQIAN